MAAITTAGIAVPTAMLRPAPGAIHRHRRDPWIWRLAADAQHRLPRPEERLGSEFSRSRTPIASVLGGLFQLFRMLDRS